MSLPPLPPFKVKPACAACGKTSTRFVDTQAGRFTLCDTCEPPDVVHTSPVRRLVTLPPLASPPGIDLPHVQIPEDIAIKARAEALAHLSKLPRLSALTLPSAAQPRIEHIKATITFGVSEALQQARHDGVAYTEQGRAMAAKVIAQGQAALYPGCPPARILASDNPWMFGDATPHKGAEDHYKCLTIDQLCAFPLPPIADDAILFMWRVAGGNEKDGSLGEQAYTVARAWGFTPKSEMVWIKTLECKECAGRGWGPLKGVPVNMAAAFAEVRVWCDACHGRGYKVARGMGRYVRGSHEVCLIATRGKPIFPEDKAMSSVFNAHRLSHSEKPLRFFERVQKLYPQGPHVELFARRRRPGWHCFGDQLPPE